MGRAFFINGESMVSVAANAAINAAYGGITQLGLSDGPIEVTPEFRFKEVMVDAWGGGEVPVDVQCMLARCNIRMTLVHFDRAVLATCVSESMGGAASEGQLPRTGTLLGGNAARGAAGNHYIGLNILSPVANSPWRFLYAFLNGPPFVFPLGTEKSLVTLNWTVLPYTTDPWGGGVGSLNASLWDHITDS